MNANEAAKALFDWLEAADATAAPLAQDYVAHITSPAMLKASQAALDLSVPFRSEQNREAIRAGLAQYTANHKFLP